MLSRVLSCYNSRLECVKWKAYHQRVRFLLTWLYVEKVANLTVTRD